jgi:hypothetical protein
MSVARLPSSFRSRNRTTREFREQFARLPARIQQLARAACLLFDGSPNHPSLRHHELKDTKKGRHVPGSFSVSITMQYRAIYVASGGINVWYWIGTHAEYDAFTGS